jgi:hypothetical protein
VRRCRKLVVTPSIAGLLSSSDLDDMVQTTPQRRRAEWNHSISPISFIVKRSVCSSSPRIQFIYRSYCPAYYAVIVRLDYYDEPIIISGSMSKPSYYCPLVCFIVSYSHGILTFKTKRSMVRHISEE